MEVFQWLANLPVCRYRRPPPGGVPGTMTTTTFLLTEKWWRWSCLLRPSVQAHLRGRWERQMCRPVLMYSFGTFMPMKTGWMVRPSCVMNVVVLNSLYACFWVRCSGQTTVSYGKSFCGCFCLGSCPFLCVWFAVSFDETQVWLGDLRVVWLVCVMVGLLWFACISGPFRSLYKWRFYCLCSCKDRATVRHRP